MSLICLCIVKGLGKSGETDFYREPLKNLAKHYDRGIKFSVDWPEPLVLRLPQDALIINVSDRPESDNCERLLLPDNWYLNGQTNEVPFCERIKVLQEISAVFTDRQYRAEWYLGTSGTEPEDFSDTTVKNCDLTDHFVKTVGVHGADSGIHIIVIP